MKMTVGEFGENSSVETEITITKNKAPPKATTAKLPVFWLARATAEAATEEAREAGRKDRGELLHFASVRSHPPASLLRGRTKVYSLV